MDREVFVQNIKSLCRARGIYPTVACRESGVGNSFINDLERGKTPSVAKVQMLANYLGVTTSELLGEHLPGDPPPPDPLDPADLQIIKAYRLADPGTQAAVRKLLDLKNDDT